MSRIHTIWHLAHCPDCPTPSLSFMDATTRDGWVDGHTAATGHQVEAGVDEWWATTWADCR